MDDDQSRIAFRFGIRDLALAIAFCAASLGCWRSSDFLALRLFGDAGYMVSLVVGSALACGFAFASVGVLFRCGLNAAICGALFGIIASILYIGYLIANFPTSLE